METLIRLVGVALFALVFSVTTADAQQAPPPLTAAVNDFAGVIDAGSHAELERLINALKAASGDVVVVATVPTIEGYLDINEFALKMFENGGRGLGEKGKDNGLLIVVAVQERKIRIETGYDVEGFVPDGYAGQIIRDGVTPHFRNGNYGAGLVTGTAAIVNRIAAGRGVQLQGVPREPVRRRTQSAPFWPTIVMIVLFMLLSRRRGGRGRRWGGGGWSSGVGPFGGGLGGGFGGGFGGFGGGGGGFGGGGGGGFGGFGGGRSGGGGASGSW
ncbi:MAG: TPM domain-containing protein [Vicinamibacterales bacterium]